MICLGSFPKMFVSHGCADDGIEVNVELQDKPKTAWISRKRPWKDCVKKCVSQPQDGHLPFLEMEL